MIICDKCEEKIEADSLCFDVTVSTRTGKSDEVLVEYYYLYCEDCHDAMRFSDG